MTRVATFGNYQSAMLDLMAAQTRGAEALQRVSTEKVATDMTGFGRQSEVLTALKGSQSRIQGFIAAAEATAARLETQDLAMNQVNDGLNGLREAIGNVLAADSAGTLMQELEGHFQAIRGGLNMRHQGSYLFSGASTSTEPMEADSLAELAAAPTVDDLFHNDDLKTASRVAEGTTLETGFLADELGAEAAAILRDIHAFHTGPNGPLDGKVTEAQKTFLKDQLTRIQAASSNVVDKIARSGSMAKQVETLTATQEAQLHSLDGLVADRTDADMAQAITDLQLSQVAIQASAQVIGQLRQSSLLNFLT